MSKPKSLAESLFDELLSEEKPTDLKDQPKVTSVQQKSLSKKNSNKKNSEINIKSYIVTTPIPTPEPVAIEDPLSDFVLQNDKLMKKLKKCRVRLPKIGPKKLLLMIKKKTIKKKNNKKNKLKLEKNINLNKSINKIKDDNNESITTNITPKKTVVRLSRVDIDNINDKTISPTRKRKSSDSPLQIKNSKKKDSPTPQSSQQSKSKLFFKLDTVPKPIRRKSIASSSPPILQQSTQKSTTKGQQTKYAVNDKSFTISHLQDTFGRQFFKCRVRVNKIHSLDNLNVKDFEMELERKEKKKLKKNKIKGLNKSVSFVETVEVFGESDSEDNTSANQELNKDIIELDALVDEQKIDGIAGGDDGGILIIDNDTTTPIKKQTLISNDENIMNKNDITTENIFTAGDELLIVSTPKDKSILSPPGKIGRMRKSFSPLKSEESPRNKLFKKGDEKIVKNFDLTVDDDEDNESDDEENEGDDDDKNDGGKNDDEEVKIIPGKSADKAEENKKLDIDTEKDTNDSTASITAKEKNEIKNITIISDQYESLSSDDSKDFVEAKDIDEEIEFKSKTNIEENNDCSNNDVNNLNEIHNICTDDEDDDYYLPKPKKIQTIDEIKDNKTQQHTSDDDAEEETIEKIICSVNEGTISNNKNQLIDNDNCCNGGDLDGNDILQKVVDTIDMLNSNIIPSDSQFGEELKLSEDDEIGNNVIEKILPTVTTTETIPTSRASPSPLTKFSFNSFLKSSIQTIKTKIMPDSPKRTTSTDDINKTIQQQSTTTTPTVTTTQQQSTETTTTKTITYITENTNDDDDDNCLIPTQAILLDEIDDESSALLGDPVLGGREMTF